MLLACNNHRQILISELSDLPKVCIQSQQSTINRAFRPSPDRPWQAPHHTPCHLNLSLDTLVPVLRIPTVTHTLLSLIPSQCMQCRVPRMAMVHISMQMATVPTHTVNLGCLLWLVHLTPCLTTPHILRSPSLTRRQIPLTNVHREVKIRVPVYLLHPQDSSNILVLMNTHRRHLDYNPRRSLPKVDLPSLLRHQSIPD
jgi:hypothetical protein